MWAPLSRASRRADSDSARARMALMAGWEAAWAGCFFFFFPSCRFRAAKKTLGVENEKTCDTKKRPSSRDASSRDDRSAARPSSRGGRLRGEASRGATVGGEASPHRANRRRTGFSLVTAAAARTAGCNRPGGARRACNTVLKVVTRVRSARDRFTFLVSQTKRGQSPRRATREREKTKT